MKELNQHQRYALMAWLAQKLSGIEADRSVISHFDEFCGGNILEWRIIYCFGMAGKIWNNDDRIYITGYSHCELSESDYQKQQIIIEDWNKEIAELMEAYS